jgi:hypothetical protein
MAEVRAWRRALREGSVVVLDDYAHADFPGVREAVQELDLPGRAEGSVWVWRV